MPPTSSLVESMNKILPDQIRVIALKPVTKGFCCWRQCTSRVYEYIIPTYAFAQFEDTRMDYRISATVVSKIQELLTMYEGTHNYHNFTSGKTFEDPSAKRYIMSFVVGEAFVVQDVEFIVLRVEGRGFVLHQIRKMIGLVIAIVRGCVAMHVLPYAYNKEKVDIPRVPGLGLLLDNVKFDNYNKRYGEDGTHQLLDWTEYEDTISKFKEEFIYTTIFDTEVRERSMMRWLETLHLHDFHETAERVKMAVDVSSEKEGTGQDEKPEEELPDDAEAAQQNIVGTSEPAAAAEQPSVL